jgi:hypothetical protein
VNAPRPTELTAATRSTTATPLARPLTVALVAAEAGRTTADQVFPPSVLCCTE